MTLSPTAWVDVNGLAIIRPRLVEAKGLGATTVWDFDKFRGK